MNKLSNIQAFTLIEVLMTTAIFAFVFGGLMMTLAAGERTWALSSAQIETQIELRKGAEFIKHELRQSGSGGVLSVPADGATYTSIQFRVADGVSGNGVTQWSANDIFYNIVSDNLIRTENGVSRILATDVETFEIVRTATDPSLLEINFAIEKDAVKGGTINEQLAFNVLMRN